MFAPCKHEQFNRRRRTARHGRDLEIGEGGTALLSSRGVSNAGARQVIDVMSRRPGEGPALRREKKRRKARKTKAAAKEDTANA